MSDDKEMDQLRAERDAWRTAAFQADEFACGLARMEFAASNYGPGSIREHIRVATHAVERERADLTKRLAACEAACAESEEFNDAAMRDRPEREDYWCARKAEASHLREKIATIRAPRVIGVAIEASVPMPDGTHAVKVRLT